MLKRSLAPIFLVVLVLVLSACNRDEDYNLGESLIYGQSVPMGNGVARSWVKLNAVGNPTSIGVSLSAEALQGLPKPAMDMNDPTMGIVYYGIDLPAEAKAKTPFNHIGVDWNPMGHPPTFYQVPHFDAHFYMITPEEQQQIGDPGSDPKILVAPQAAYLPTDYVDAQVNVPQMGKHWFDKYSPELHDQGFTQTFIYGSYNGQVSFLEPMFTEAYLLSKPNDTFPIKQPEKFQRKGLYYPTDYTIRYNAKTKEYIISLNNMKLR